MGCSVEGCEKGAVTRGYCEMHYRRWLKHGDPEKGARSQIKPCSVEGCPNPGEARTLCHGPITSLYCERVSGRQNFLAIDWLAFVRCRIAVGESSGLCKAHDRRLKLHGAVTADIPLKVVVGNGHINHGYMQVPVPVELRHLTRGETPIAEHRLAMAIHLDRALEADEVVHHLNGDRLDNRIENLELWSFYQPKGQRTENKVEFAIEILRRYRPDLLAD